MSEEIKKEILPADTDIASVAIPVVKDIGNNDIKLYVKLEIKEKGGKTPVSIDQEIVLPGLLMPSFLKGSYTQVENTLNMVGIDMFKALAKQYFFDKINQTFQQSDDVRSLNYEHGVVYNDEKRLITEELDERMGGGMLNHPEDSLLDDATNRQAIELEVEK